MAKYQTNENNEYLLEQNLLGANSFSELERLETVAYLSRALELVRNDFLPEDYSFTSLKHLHFRLFQDIYPFAGKVRNVQISKGQTRFCQFQFIDGEAERIFAEMSNESVWPSKSFAAERLAYYKAELNMLHPFREGNGRTIRLFLRFYARFKGYEWNSELIERNTYLNAMIRSVGSDMEPLRKIIIETLSEAVND
jgi:cell filamentation protein